MRYNVIILSEAELDIDNAYLWYEIQQIDLGNKFYSIVDKSISYISHNPFSSIVIYKGIRRYLIKKFPFGIYYKVNIELKEVQILGVIHFKRNLKILRKINKKKY